MSSHPSIPILCPPFAPKFAKFANEGPVRLWFLDVNNATYLLDPNRIRMSHVPSANAGVTALLNAWLGRLFDACPPGVRLMTSGGDEVLAIAPPELPVAAIGAMIEASQAPGKMSPLGEVLLPSLTVGCAGIVVGPGSDGEWISTTLTVGYRRAKHVGKSMQPKRSAICTSSDGIIWEDYVLAAPVEPQDDDEDADQIAAGAVQS